MLDTNTPATNGGHSLAEILTMTNYAETAHQLDEQRIVDMGRFWLREFCGFGNGSPCPCPRSRRKNWVIRLLDLGISSETVLSVVHGG